MTFQRIIDWSLRSSFNDSREGFYDDIAEAIEDGDPPVQFLTENIEYFERHGNKMSRLYQGFLEQLDEFHGKLSSIFVGVVPDGDMVLLTSIDDGDDEQRVTGFRNIALRTRAVKRMKKTLIEAVALPAFVFPLMMAYMVILAVFIIPEMESILPHQHWKIHERGLYWISYAITKFWYLFVVSGLALGLFYIRSFAHWTGDRRNSFCEMPLIGLPHRLYRDFSAANFVTGLAALLNSNDDLVNSLERLAETANPYMNWHIQTIISNLNDDAATTAEAFDTGLLSEEMHRRLTNYARRKEGNFVAGLVRLGSESVSKVDDVVRSSSVKLAIVLTISGFLMILVTYGTFTSLNWTIQRHLKQQGEFVRPL